MQNPTVAPQVKAKVKVFTRICKVLPSEALLDHPALSPSPCLAHLLQPCYFWKTWHTIPAQGHGICWSLYLECSSPEIHWACSLNTYKYLFKCHPLIKASLSSLFELAASLSAFPIPSLSSRKHLSPSNRLFRYHSWLFVAFHQ